MNTCGVRVTRSVVSSKTAPEIESSGIECKV